MRVGHGFDAHGFTQGQGIVLGGVSIAYDRTFAAHSDGDVLVHALCDALLGAAALGDIGKHFPDSSAEFAGIDSRVLLRRVMDMLQENGWRVANADLTVIAQAPRIAPHVGQMRDNLAADLEVGAGQVNVKATTTEGMGFTGRGEGVAAHALVLLMAAGNRE